MTSLTKWTPNITKYGVLVIILFFIQCREVPQVKVNTEPAFPPYMDSLLSTHYIMGHFDPREHGDFVEIDKVHTERNGLYLHKMAYGAFTEMWNAAKESGISLQILSATRNFGYQKGIWERKWSGNTKLSDGTDASKMNDPEEKAKKILLYSSMPGTSRHHWGTDIDLNSLNNEYFENANGKTIYEWLKTNAPKFGFCQPYTSKNQGRTGYEEEKWHWSYMPISVHLTKYCKENLKDSMIRGFNGAEVAEQINVVQHYVLGISPDCLIVK